MTEAAAQLTRTSEALNRLRALGENLRDPRLRGPHARMTAAFTRAERIVQVSREVTRETKTILTETVLARQERENDLRPRRSLAGTSAAPVEREVVLQNIRLFQRLLQQDADNCQDTRTERIAEAVAGPGKRETRGSRSARGRLRPPSLSSSGSAHCQGRAASMNARTSSSSGGFSSTLIST